MFPLRLALASEEGGRTVTVVRQYEVYWRRDREAEGTSLLTRQGVKALEGSNPSVSALTILVILNTWRYD